MGIGNLGACLGAVQDGDYYQLPWGKAIFRNNEWHILTETADPGGISIIGFTGCKISWKDGDGNEKVLSEMRINADGNGEYYFGCFDQKVYDGLLAEGGAWAAKALDLAMIEVATLNATGLEIRVPIKASAGYVGAAPPAVPVDPIEAAVAAGYLLQLGRPADPGGLASWAQDMRDGMTEAQMLQGLHDSAEGVAYRKSQGLA